MHWASGIPHALFGRKIYANLGRIAPRECGTMSPRHCEERLVRRSSKSEGGSDDAIHSFFVRRNGLLRFARNDDLRLFENRTSPCSCPPKPAFGRRRMRGEVGDGAIAKSPGEGGLS